MSDEYERERERQRIAEIIRRGTGNLSPEEIAKENEERRQEQILQRVGAAFLRTVRRLS